MSLELAFLVFMIGVILVVKGGDWFVDAASWIAKAAGVPSFLIGATIVSFATTMPEMIVSVTAAVQGKNDMAIGNAVGSVNVNTGLIMGLAIIFLTVITKREKYLKQCLFLIATAAFLWIGSSSGNLKTWASLILVCLFLAFMFFNAKDAKNEMAAAQKESFERKDLGKNILLFVAGAAGIVIGSQCLVNGGSDLAAALGVPERVIAVTMVAIGTSLPELITTITAIRKKESSLSVGNIIGANLIDLALILPLCSFVSGTEYAVSAQALALDLPFCLIITLVALLPMLIKEKAYKAQGILMVALYAAYLFRSL